MCKYISHCECAHIFLFRENLVDVMANLGNWRASLRSAPSNCLTGQHYGILPKAFGVDKCFHAVNCKWECLQFTVLGYTVKGSVMAAASFLLCSETNVFYFHGNL
jgi:hypothetical protein